MARRVSRRGIDLMIAAAGGPNGEEVEIPPVRVIDPWNPLRFNAWNMQIEANEVEVLEEIPWPTSEIRVYEKLPEPDDLMHLELEQFKDQPIAEEYVCQICFLVCNYLYTHVYRDCQAFMCLTCFNGLRQVRQNNDCIRKCHRGNFIEEMKPLSHRPPRTLNNLRTLRILCPQKCDELINFTNFRKHLKKFCAKDKNFCEHCKQIHVSTFQCREKLTFEKAKLQEEVDRLKRELELAKSSNQVRENQSECMHSTFSNPIKGKRHWDGKNARIAAHFKGKEFRFSDLDIDENTGLDLRKKIESLVGEKVGSIVKLDHTIIQDERRIRQNMISHKPAHLLVYPLNETIGEGHTLKVDVRHPGGIV